MTRSLRDPASRPLPRWRSHSPLHRIIALGVTCLAFGAGCASSEEVSERRFELRLSATDEDGRALPAVGFSWGESVLGTTDEEGRAGVILRGREGVTLSLGVTCPEGYEGHAPVEARLATARAIGEETPRPLELEVVCQRSTRDVVLVVHAPGGKNLPVTIEGRAFGATDENGSAHVALSLPRESSTLQVQLGTEEEKRLRPQNPTRTFELGEQDTIVVFEQSFSLASLPRRAAPRAAPPARHVPVRIR